MAGRHVARWAAGAFAGVWLMGAAEPTLSQSYVEAPCTAQAAPAFEDHLQSLWYRRFWTGECRDLPGLRCMRGRPYWNDVVRTLTARAPAGRRSEIASSACRLGHRIGFEWTRPSARRRIDSRDLRSLAATLEKAPDVTAGLAAVEARVEATIGP
jgi:hypothetical protein